jgi:tRNA-splicing ligase RtcB
MAIIDSLQKISDTIWEVPTTYKEGMRVPARIIATEKLVREMDEAVYQQISNVATLPGITRYALCMPDGHSGYGFPMGGVAAMDVHEGGVISPGGIGFDGIHYNRESGEAWAKPVNATLDRILAAEIAARHKVASNH